MVEIISEQHDQSSNQECISTQTFQAKDLPFKYVTVYIDQAEVHRKLLVVLEQGLNKIQIENFSTNLDKDSLRVDGHGSATIHEVQIKNKIAKQGEDQEDSKEVKELKNKIKELEEKKSKINIALNIYVKHLSALDNLTSNILKFSIANDDNHPRQFDESAESSVEKLLNYHDKKSSEIGIKGWEYEREVKEINAEIDKITTKINRAKFNSVQKKYIVIVLETTQEGGSKVELDISYQVNKASWKPSYDIRVQTNENSDDNKLKIVYFGNVQQASGEDWKDTELILSTGQPKTAETLPKIAQLNVRFKHEHPTTTTTAKRSYAPAPYPPMMLQNQQFVPRGPLFGALPQMQQQAPTAALFGAAGGSTFSSGTFGYSSSIPQEQVRQYEQEIEEAAIAALPEDDEAVEFSECKANENQLTSTFTVQQIKTIPSDEAEHKVTISTLELDSTFYYACVPKKNTSVFLTAEIKNTSAFPLLAGNATIYLNNAFTQNTTIDRIGIGEKFSRSLGADPSIKVEYKPLKCKSEKQFDVVSSNVFEQPIVLKNNKNEPILLSLYEQIPKSTNDNIKVKLIAPEGIPEFEKSSKSENHEEAGVKFNDLNNLEWKIQLAPDEEKEILIKWSVDYPQNKTIEYFETSGEAQKSFKLGL